MRQEIWKNITSNEQTLVYAHDDDIVKYDDGTNENRKLYDFSVQGHALWSRAHLGKKLNRFFQRDLYSDRDHDVKDGRQNRNYGF